MDTTPPDPGVVYDGPRPELGFQDLDYTTEATSLSAHWNGWYDPHTEITEYYVAIGTCQACVDIQDWTSNGIKTGELAIIWWTHVYFACRWDVP